MKKLLLAFGLIISSLHAYSQNGYSSVFLRVTDSATFVNSANTVAKHAADYADIWYSVNSGLFWEWDAGTSAYVILGSKSIGAYGWLTSGLTNLTGGAEIALNGNNIIFTEGGDNFFEVTSGAASLQGHSGSDNTLIEATATTAVMQNNNNNKVEVNASGVLIRAGNAGDDITLTTGSTARLTIDSDGSFDLGVGLDPGTATHVLTSNGAGSAPTWQAPSGGSGVTTMAAIGATPNANGATISGSTLNLQPASTSFGGVVTTGTQSFAGAKTFVTATDFLTVNTTSNSADGVGLEIQQDGLDANGAILNFYNRRTGVTSGARIFENHSYINNSSAAKMQMTAIYGESVSNTAGAEYGRLLANVNAGGASATTGAYGAWDIGPINNAAGTPSGLWFKYCDFCDANAGIVSSINNVNTGATALTEMRVGNESHNLTTNSTSSLRLMTLGRSYTTSGAYVQDAATIEAGSNLSGGMTFISSHASGGFRWYTGGTAAANIAMTMDNTGLVHLRPGMLIGGITTAPGYISLYEDLDDGVNFTKFQPQAQAASITYTLPAAVPTTSGAMLTATTAGVMSWVDKLAGSATLNFDLTSVNSEDLTITVTGAADGDVVSMGHVNASATANVTYTAWVSATNTVTIRAARIDVASGADPASGTFKAIVFK